jgi:PAS domain S-box-containing protein
VKKLVNYLPFFVLFFLPLLFYGVVDKYGWKSSSDVHAVLEFASSLLAITAGVMVLMHFYASGYRSFLIISVGFVLIGAEEFVHAIFSFNRIWGEIPATFKLAVSTSWLSGQFVLLVSFLIALISGERQIVTVKRRRYAIVFNIIGVIFVSFVSLLIFNSPFLPEFVQLGSNTKKQIELFLAFLYFVSFIFYFRIYLKQKTHSLLFWSILACIIFRVLAHIFIFDSQTFYDSHWDAGHLFVFLSYFFPIFGVWRETIKILHNSQLQLVELANEIEEHKLSEEKLRLSESKYYSLFTNLDEGFCIVEMIFDDKGKPIDYLFLEINPAFEKQTGLINARGRRMRELAPEHEEYWFEIYGKIAITGEPVRFINYAEQLHRWFDVYAFPADQSENRKVAILFTDITERKKMEENLLEREEKYRNLFNNSEVGMLRTRLDGSEILEFNEKYLKILNYTSEEAMGTPSLNMWAKKHERDKMVQILKSEGHVTDFECDLLNKQGDVINCIASMRLYPEEGILEGSIHDITEQKLAKAELQIALTKYKTLFECFPLGITISDDSGRIVETNSTAEKLLNKTHNEQIQLDIDGKEWCIVRTDGTPMPPDEYASSRALKDNCVVENIEMGIVKPDNTITWISVTSAPLPMQGYGVVITYNDITSRKLAEEDVVNMKYSLKKLNQYLNEIRENERALISREIHDELGQSLTALKIDLNWLRRQIPGDSDSGVKLKGMIELVNVTISDVQRISSDLRPAILDDLGLAPAMEWFTDEFIKRTKKQVNLKIETGADISKKIEIVIFRIFQESLTNIARHSGAKKVEIVLRKNLRDLILDISDDGKGIAEKEMHSSRSLGLLNMKERARDIGGSLTFKSGPDGGTRVELIIPEVVLH